MTNVSFRCFAFFLTLVWANSVSANDTMVSLGAGGLVPRESPDVSMESEDLDISVREIKIRYVFRNHSSRDIDATVAFPLPPLDGRIVAIEP
ncbi:MAG: DUF4424 family protein, partial [Alphaproteobacteria bacterium]|nr:DUF4424 family protein [Alphaproteobacteria bacterium]